MRTGGQLSVDNCEFITGHLAVKHSSCEENYALCSEMGAMRHHFLAKISLKPTLAPVLVDYK